jgi:hypothetical protein
MTIFVPTRRRNLYLPDYRAAFACSHFRYPHRLCGAVTEKLSESFFVVSNAVLFDQCDEVGRCVSRERGFGEVRIVGNKVFRLAVQVGEVAAPTTGDQDLFAYAPSAFQHYDARSALPCLHGAHETRRAAAENDDVKFVFHDLRMSRSVMSACWR